MSAPVGGNQPLLPQQNLPPVGGEVKPVIIKLGGEEYAVKELFVGGQWLVKAGKLNVSAETIQSIAQELLSGEVGKEVASLKPDGGEVRVSTTPEKVTVTSGNQLKEITGDVAKKYLERVTTTFQQRLYPRAENVEVSVVPHEKPKKSKKAKGAGASTAATPLSPDKKAKLKAAVPPTNERSGGWLILKSQQDRLPATTAARVGHFFLGLAKLALTAAIGFFAATAYIPAQLFMLAAAGVTIAVYTIALAAIAVIYASIVDRKAAGILGLSILGTGAAIAFSPTLVVASSLPLLKSAYHDFKLSVTGKA